LPTSSEAHAGGAVAIRAEGLSKRYTLGTRARHGSLREALSGGVRSFGARLAGRGPDTSRPTVWALKDVTFELPMGRILGVLGPNGAGKSTLLKILSGITEPTDGRAAVRGRVSSLLEVGTGFHAELTGRENVFLNGTILGMSRREVARRFDEIVDFAGVAPFIDTPVKHYSTGMYLRLGFAVAAHLETDILLVDEVLAVGDVALQKKCLGKLGEVASQGRTVVFVSHAMAILESLCDTGLVLAGGQVAYLGPIRDAVKRYLATVEATPGPVDLSAAPRVHAPSALKLLRFWAEDANGVATASIRTGEACALAAAYEALDGQPHEEVFLSFTLRTVQGAPVAVVNTNLLGQDFSRAPARGVIRFLIPRLPLTAGRYGVDLHLGERSGYSPSDAVFGVASFDVIEGDFYGTGRPGSTQAPVLLDGRWRLEEQA